MKRHIRFTAHAAVALTAVTASALLVSFIANMSLADEEETLALDLQLYAAPLQVVKKEKIRIDWDSPGADYCTASGSWTGRKEPSGSVRIQAKKKTETFTLQCFDQDGDTSEKITRKVSVVATKKQLKRKKLEAPKPFVNGPAYATEGQDIVVSWGSTKGTVACRATGQESWDGLIGHTGSDTFQASVGSEYRLSCWNENGQEGMSVVYTVKAKPKKYTAADVGLSAEYLPMYPDDAATSALAEENGVYFIDFVKIKENGPTLMDDEYYWGKRVVLNIYTNLIIDNNDILEEVFAAPGQVPPDVNPSTKRIYATKNIEERTNDDMWRFINWGSEDTRYGEIPTLSPDDFGRLAIDYTLEHLQLPLNDDYQKFYTPSPVVFWYNGAVAGPPVFAVVDVYNNDGERIRRVVMDAYTGENMTDKHIFDGEGFNGVIWDRTIMKERDEAAASVVTPPTQTPVTSPATETKTEEQKASTKCSSGFVWSPTLGQCYEDTTVKQGSETKSSCAVGYSYSITLKTCVKD